MIIFVVMYVRTCGDVSKRWSKKRQLFLVQLRKGAHLFLNGPSLDLFGPYFRDIPMCVVGAIMKPFVEEIIQVLRRVPFSWLVFSDLSLIKNMVKYGNNKETSQLIGEPS